MTKVTAGEQDEFKEEDLSLEEEPKEDDWAQVYKSNHRLKWEVGKATQANQESSPGKESPPKSPDRANGLVTMKKTFSRNLDEQHQVSPEWARHVANSWFENFFDQDFEHIPQKLKLSEFKMFLAQYPAIWEAF